MIRYKQKNPDNVRYRIGKRILIFLLIIGIPAILFISFYSIKKVEVVGINRYTEDQIKNMVFQSEIDHNSLILYLKYKLLNNPKLPFIEKIKIKMKDNHSVTIYVYEKMVAGCVEFMGEYLYFDKDGIVIESTSTKLKQVPLIKGLKYNEIILNKKLDILQNTQPDIQQKEQQDKQLKEQQNIEEKKKEQNDEIFHVIINLTQLIEKYELNVDTISFNSNYEVILDCKDITVLLGKKKNYDESFAELRNILAEEKTKGLKITLDMRDYKKGMEVIGKTKKTTE